MPSRSSLQLQRDALSRTRVSIKQTLSARPARSPGLHGSLRELQRTLGNAHLQRMLGALARAPDDSQAPFGGRVARSGAGGCSCGGACAGCKEGAAEALDDDTEREDEGGKPSPHDGGAATIQCDGNGGWEVMLNGKAGAPCGIPGCTTKHEQSHIADWKAKWPNGCKGQARGYLPKGDPPDDPLMTVAEYNEFLNKSECKAYGVGLTCANGLDKKEPCKQPVQDYIDFCKKWQKHYCK